MSQTIARRQGEWDTRERILAGVVACGLAVLFCVARSLEPNPAGMGTHEQLGLPPCSFLAFSGFPCPACGMTTSWSRLFRGEWLEAWRANQGGVLLAVTAVATLFWLLGIAWFGRTLIRIPTSLLVVLALLVMVVTCVDWVDRCLARF